MLSEIASKPIGRKGRLCVDEHKIGVDSHLPESEPLPMKEGDRNTDSCVSDDDTLKKNSKETHYHKDSYTDESHEKNNKAFIESVKSCVVEIHKLPNEGKTQLKHFCAYICRRLDQRTGDTYVPTNATTSTITSEMKEEYHTWFVKKIKLPRDTFDFSVKSGNAFHWRQYLKSTYRTCDITKNVLRILPMCTQWLRRSEKRMKKKNTVE